MFKHLLSIICLAALCACQRADVIVVGMDATYPPFEFVDEGGNIRGVSVEIGRQIAADLGKPVEFHNISFDGLIPALQTGRIDLIISSLSANETRRQSIDFSVPYVKTGLSILAANQSTVQTAADLRAPGRKIAVRISTTGEQWCRQHLPDAKLVSLDTDAACVLEVVNGTVDAWVYDQVSIMNYHARHPDTTRALLAPLREEVWAVGIRKGRDDLRKIVDQTITRMQSTGVFEQFATTYLAKERAQMQAQGLPFVFELKP